MLDKLTRARQAKADVDAAAAASALTHSMSDGRVPELPDVDPHLYLPKLSTLLTDAENARIQAANYEDGTFFEHGMLLWKNADALYQ